MKCVNGHENPDSADFCMACGTRVVEPVNNVGEEKATSFASPKAHSAMPVMVALLVAGALLVAVALAVALLGDNRDQADSGTTDVSSTSDSTDLDMDAIVYCAQMETVGASATLETFIERAVMLGEDPEETYRVIESAVRSQCPEWLPATQAWFRSNLLE